MTVPARRTAVHLAIIVLLGSLAACEARPFQTILPGEPSLAGQPTPTAVAGSPATTLGSTPGSTVGSSVGPVVVPSGGTWGRIEVDGPSPAAREDHTWTVGDDGRAYLFGGRDGGTNFDDLWAFDLEQAAWSRIQAGPDRPPARFGHEAAWAPGLGLVVWAGQAGATFFDDLWLFEPSLASWRRLAGRGDAPIARYGSCSGIAPDGRLWISHGFTADGARFADTRAYNFATDQWTDESPLGDGPIERCLHACWWTSDGRLTLYGGQTTGTPALGDLWFLTPGPFVGSPSAWAEAPMQELSERQLAAVTRHGQLTVLFGGRDLQREPLADAWLLADDATRFVPLETNDGPRGRSGAAMIDDTDRGRVLLFGGEAANALDDLWELTFR